MRFGARFILDKEPYFIPHDYRKHFLSLIKEAIKLSDIKLFEKFYGNNSKNRQKPFTFSVSFVSSDNQSEKGKIFLDSNKVTLHFSSFDPKVLINVYNGFVKLSKEKSLNYLGGSIQINRFFYKQRKLINSDRVTFKTLSPIVVRELKDKKGVGFIDCNHPDFKKNLFYNVKSIAKVFLDYDLKEDEFQIFDLRIKSKKVNIYGKEIANKGIFTVKAPVSILQLIYDAGIGAKRSQGFGMLEVIG
ncbi:CRISPR-associated endoribonuclease Cas6 [Deferribacter autotrophicus]|uniref:CRISPR-associated endoribonuclease Cas6 n=1 Tax=Deferribacter autotrophicus TaxID=500465 RepID=UPI00165D9A64|nr:CRISPR-associated endoribonuclease Cas6 [Deferribacter autotrophicus]